MPQQKTAVTVRLNPDLLADVKASALKDNRSLTNFIEVALRERIEASAKSRVRAVSSQARSFKKSINQ